MRKRIIKIYCGILAVGLPYLFWILITGKKLPCFYYENMGIECPACGNTRMFLSMAKLDFISAFFYNPVSFILFFIWNFVALLCFWGKIKFVQNPKFLYTLFGFSVAIYVIWGFIRNLS